MKRNHSASSSSNHVPFHPQPPTNFSGGDLIRGGCGGGGYKPVPVDVDGKGKMWEESPAEQDDELLAVLGYKVRSSDMVSVAQKLEHLEEKMGQAQGDGLTHLGSDAVHYNPSDLYSWLESMICELNPVPADDCFIPPPSQTDKITSAAGVAAVPPAATVSIFEGNSGLPDYDLKAIPGQAIYPVIGQNDSQLTSQANKKLKPTPATVPMAAPVVLIDSQEQGIRLIHTLMACAEAVQQDNLSLAQALVDQMGILAVSQAGAMRKVATYFTQALGRRVFGLLPQTPQDSAFSDLLQMHFYETCPYLKFAHFTANQAILEAFTNKKRVHVIDFSMKQGMQWPALMQALALRPGGPPTFRLTGIGPPSLDNTDHLQGVGWKLAQLAETIHVEFEYRGFVANSVADIDASMLNLREDEVVAVNSVFELHPLLARPGAIEKVFSAVKDMKPEILTVVEQEANHNGPVFLDRFTEALHYYSTMFDSLESSGVGGGDTVVDMVASNEDKIMSEVYLGRQILNIVACEGFDRVERHETLTQWQARFDSAGFEPVHLGSNAYKQASMLLALFAGGGGYRVEENNGCLMLGWHTRPLIATSAWKLK